VHPGPGKLRAVQPGSGPAGPPTQSHVPITDKFEAAVSRLPSRARIVAAVSGGADSVALLHLLNGRGFSIVVGHFDHGTRKGQSAEDARFVARLAERLGLQAEIGRGDVEKARRELGMSFQEAARLLRHRFLESLRVEREAGWIALGHTADDQVETLLINLLRGSGPRGLAAMSERSGPLIRPLIACWRAEIEVYLRKQGIEYLHDASNDDPHYLRNRVRHKLVPSLRAINPRIRETLWRTARVLDDEDEFMESFARARFDERFPGWSPGEPLPLGGFSGEPVALKRRWLRHVVKESLGSLRRIGAGHIEALLDLVDRPRVGRQTSLPGASSAVIGYGGLEFICTPIPLSCILEESETGDGEILWLAVPGKTALPGGQEIVTRLISPEEAKGRPPSKRTARFDADLAGANIGVRGFRPGDRFQPLGMTGTKKVKAYFIDEKIPAALRRSVPIIVGGDEEILWIAGHRASALHPVTDATRRVLEIALEAAPDGQGA